MQEDIPPLFLLILIMSLSRILLLPHFFFFLWSSHPWTMNVQVFSWGFSVSHEEKLKLKPLFLMNLEEVSFQDKTSLFLPPETTLDSWWYIMSFWFLSKNKIRRNRLHSQRMSAFLEIPLTNLRPVKKYQHKLLLMMEDFYLLSSLQFSVWFL